MNWGMTCMQEGNACNVLLWSQRRQLSFWGECQGVKELVCPGSEEWQWDFCTCGKSLVTRSMTKAHRCTRPWEMWVVSKDTHLSKYIILFSHNLFLTPFQGVMFEIICLLLAYSRKHIFWDGARFWWGILVSCFFQFWLCIRKIFPQKSFFRKAGDFARHVNPVPCLLWVWTCGMSQLLKKSVWWISQIHLYNLRLHS